MSDDTKPNREDREVEDKATVGAPPAGPHSRDDLTNRDATPGTGSLPDPKPTGDADAGVG